MCVAELHRLQANAEEVESLEKKVANLEEELQAAQRHCAQKDQVNMCAHSRPV